MDGQIGRVLNLLIFGGFFFVFWLQTTQLTARRKDLILLNDENKLELNQAALDDLAKIQEKIVPIARTGNSFSCGELLFRLLWL